MKAVTPGNRPKGTSRPLEAAPSGATLRVACQDLEFTDAGKKINATSNPLVYGFHTAETLRDL